MSYEKLTVEILGMADAVAATLAQHSVTIAGLADELTAAGAVVQLDGTSGPLVWVSCIVHDRPETPQIDLITVAIACTSSAPRTKPNGQYVAQAFWSAFWPAALVSIGIDTARKALMMVALGEPQPQVPIPIPADGGPTEQDAVPMATPETHSIRTQIAVADECAPPLSDVL